jgi:ABC-type sulfate transport system permease component
VTHPEGRKDSRMAPAVKWFLVAAGVVLLLFFLLPLLRATDEDFIEPPATPRSENVGSAR